MPKNKKEGDSEKKVFAFICILVPIIGALIALLIKKADKYVKFYAKQGLILTIGQLIILCASWALGIYLQVLWIFWLIPWIFAMINSFSGKEKNTWLIGNLAEKIKL